MGRMQLARALASAGKLDEATDAYSWLGEHMLEHEPAMVGVRFSFMLAEIGDLVARHPPARAKFATLRDAAAPQPESASASFDDWVALNQALGEPEKPCTGSIANGSVSRRDERRNRLPRASAGRAELRPAS